MLWKRDPVCINHLQGSQFTAYPRQRAPLLWLSWAHFYTQSQTLVLPVVLRDLKE